MAWQIAFGILLYFDAVSAAWLLDFMMSAKREERR